MTSFSLKMGEIRYLKLFLLNKHHQEADKQPLVAAGIKNSSGRICSCQILDLESSNYNHQHVVLLAEKANYGNSNDLNIARSHIEKEKKHLRQMFYDKIKTLSEIHQTGSCKALYYQLKTADSQLQLYEILDADIN